MNQLDRRIVELLGLDPTVDFNPSTDKADSQILEKIMEKRGFLHSFWFSHLGHKYPTVSFSRKGAYAYQCAPIRERATCYAAIAAIESFTRLHMYANFTIGSMVAVDVHRGLKLVGQVTSVPKPPHLNNMTIKPVWMSAKTATPIPLYHLAPTLRIRSIKIVEPALPFDQTDFTAFFGGVNHEAQGA